MAEFDIDPILADVDRALAEGDGPRGFALLAPFADQLERDPRLASVWLTLLRVVPGRASLKDDVARIVARWPDDRDLRLAGCDALIRAAERLGPDAPIDRDGPAARAAQLAAQGVAAVSEDERRDPKIGGYWLMTHANALRLAHLHDEAQATYTAALALDPNNGDWWFNVGLLHKAQHDFARGLEAAERAHTLLGDRRGVLWNIAICATALGRGEVAVDALRALGFSPQLTAAGMPFVDGLPPLQVRVATRGGGIGFGGADLDRSVAFELVWVSPASPVHGVVQTPTFRESSVDYGDLVLWDGTPIGVTERDGKPIPRFPLLSRLRAGDERRLRFIALEQAEGDTQRMGDALPDGALLFVHRATVEHLCSRCASGEHMQKHKHTAPEPHRLVYGKMIVPGTIDLAAFRRALDAHLARHPSVQIVMPSLYEALGETATAGKAHQIWRGIERTALKTDGAIAVPRA
jgi:tetratricopeptide (TPR) repeat protein